MIEPTHTFSFLTNWSKRLVLPGFRGMSLYEVAIFFIKGLEEGAITTRASAIAFNFFHCAIVLILASDL